jgi:hypothetical protein
MDNLIFELSRHDCGVEHKRTQFPIEDYAKVFQGRRENYLQGIDLVQSSNRAIAAVQGMLMEQSTPRHVEQR